MSKSIREIYTNSGWLSQQCQDFAVKMTTTEPGKQVSFCTRFTKFVAGRTVGVIVKPIARIVDIAGCLFAGLLHVIPGTLIKVCRFIVCRPSNHQMFKPSLGIKLLAVAILFSFDACLSVFLNPFNPNLLQFRQAQPQNHPTKGQPLLSDAFMDGATIESVLSDPEPDQSSTSQRQELVDIINSDQELRELIPTQSQPNPVPTSSSASATSSASDLSMNLLRSLDKLVEGRFSSYSDIPKYSEKLDIFYESDTAKIRQNMIDTIMRADGPYGELLVIKLTGEFMPLGFSALKVETLLVLGDLSGNGNWTQITNPGLRRPTFFLDDLFDSEGNITKSNYDLEGKWLLEDLLKKGKGDDNFRQDSSLLENAERDPQEWKIG